MFETYEEDKLKRLDRRVKTGLRKLRKETDLSWEELIEQLGENIHPDEFRKRSYGYQEYEYLNQHKLSQNATQEELELLNERRIELQKEKVKVTDMKTYVNKKLREISRNENLLELARDLVNAMEGHYPLIPSRVPKSTRTTEEVEAILVLSDWHIGIEIENSWNKFNLEILKERLAYLKGKTIDYCKENKVNKLHVVICGDIISGLIHSTIRIENRIDVVQQTLMASEIISELLQYFAMFFDVEVYNSVGNHDRVTANKSDNMDKESFGYLMQEMINLRCSKLQNVHFNENTIDDELITFDCLGWKVVATHGDKFGRKTDIISKLTSMLKYVPDYVIMGHLHQHYESTFGESELIINPSLSGVDTYAKNLGLIGRPAQKLLIIDKKIGKKCGYSIYLDNLE